MLLIDYFIIYTDWIDLISLEGDILLKITETRFLITIIVLNEDLDAVNNLSKVLQKENLQLLSVSISISLRFVILKQSWISIHQMAKIIQMTEI